MDLAREPFWVKIFVLLPLSFLVAAGITVISLAVPALIYLVLLVIAYLYSGTWYSISPNELGLSSLPILSEGQSWKGLKDIIIKVGEWDLLFSIPTFLCFVLFTILFVVITLLLIKEEVMKVVRNDE